MSLVQVQLEELNFIKRLEAISIVFFLIIEELEHPDVIGSVSGSIPAGGARFFNAVERIFNRFFFLIIEELEHPDVIGSIAGSSPAGGARFLMRLKEFSIAFFILILEELEHPDGYWECRRCKSSWRSEIL